MTTTSTSDRPWPRRPLRCGLRATAWAAALLLLAACGRSGPAAQPFHGTDITGAELAPTFSLEDARGQRRTAEDFKGKLLAVYFGFTHCPDVCPTTLADLAATAKVLGVQRERMQVVFITLDPERDTGPELARYLAAFDPGFIGLRGDEAATRQVTNRFRLYVEKRPARGSEAAGLDHSSTVFVFDAAGKPRLMFGQGVSADQMAADLKRLM